MGNLHGCDSAIAPDGSFLVFYSIEPGARGGTPTDLYLTLRRPDDTWTEPQRMGPGINTGYYEMAARISPDKKYMFFTRSTGWNTNAATDTANIYWVELEENLSGQGLRTFVENLDIVVVYVYTVPLFTGDFPHDAKCSQAHYRTAHGGWS
jgi:hypothetical protein